MNDTLDRAVQTAIADLLDAGPEWHQLRPLRAVGESPPTRFRPVARRSLVAALAGASVAAGAVGVTLVARDRGSAPASSPTTVLTTEPVSSQPTGSPAGNPGFRPTVLPDDLFIAQVMLPPAGYEPPERPTEGVLWMILGHRDAAGEIDASIRLQVDYGRLFAPLVGPTSQWTRESTTIAGVPAEIVRDSINGLTIVEYQVGEQVVMLESNDADDPGVLDAMLAIAGTVRVDEGIAQLDAALPGGYESLTEASEPPNDIATSLWYSDGTNVRAIHVQFNRDPPDDFQFWFMRDGLADVTVRGADGFVTTSDPPSEFSRDESVTVMWLERPDLLVSVSGYAGITEEQVIAAAESLEPMTDAQFDALQRQADAAGGGTETTQVGAVEIVTSAPQSTT